MIYKSLNPVIHILYEPMDRKKLELELIFTSGGSWFEESKDRGKKHLLEHCIASRTKEYDFQSLKDLQYKENLTLNAYTGPITMGLTASGHYSDFKIMTDLLLEMAFEPTFDQEIIDREKEVVLREISERRGEASYRLHFQVMKKAFKAGSYSIHEVLGDPKLVKQTTLEDFYRLQEQNLEKSHIIFSLSGGGIDQIYVENEIKKYIQRNPVLSQLENKNPINYDAKNKINSFSILPVVSKLAHEHAEITVFIPTAVSFENKPALQIFENLFLNYGGVLYDRLRDELGLVYGLQSSFDFSMQTMELYLSCEIKYINIILDEINKVFSDFTKYFNLKKFSEFRKIIHKKQDIAQDSLGASASFTQNMIKLYGIAESQIEYAQRLDQVSVDDIEIIYESIKNNLDKRQVILVSNDKSINKLAK